MALPSLARVPAPPDSILGLAEAARADTRAGKINLSLGVFVDESGTTPVLPSVTEAERRILAAGRTKLYRPIDGEAAFRDAVRDLVFTPDHEVVRSGRVAVSQTPGGTGGLRVAADFLRQTGGGGTIWMSQPTWPNHPQLFLAAGFRIREYPYTDPTGRRIDEPALLAALGQSSPGDVVLLHGSCHNPTGVDPSPELWRKIGDLVEDRRLLPLVDFAYQGFGHGLREDADWMDGLLRPGLELLVSTSYSKSFALYNERVLATSRSPFAPTTPTRRPTAVTSWRRSSGTRRCGPSGRSNWPGCGTGSRRTARPSWRRSRREGSRATGPRSRRSAGCSRSSG